MFTTISKADIDKKKTLKKNNNTDSDFAQGIADLLGPWELLNFATGYFYSFGFVNLIQFQQ